MGSAGQDVHETCDVPRSYYGGPLHRRVDAGVGRRTQSRTDISRTLVRAGQEATHHGAGVASSGEERRDLLAETQKSASFSVGGQSSGSLHLEKQDITVSFPDGDVARPDGHLRRQQHRSERPVRQHQSQFGGRALTQV